MKRRGLLIGLAAIVLVLAVPAFFMVGGARSVVIIDNQSGETVDLSITMTNPGQFDWSGSLSPRQRVIRLARFGDNSFHTTCRDASGVHQGGGGYVTGGLPQQIDIRLKGCDDVSVDVKMIP